MARWKWPWVSRRRLEESRHFASLWARSAFREERKRLALEAELRLQAEQHQAALRDLEERVQRDAAYFALDNLAVALADLQRTLAEQNVAAIERIEVEAGYIVEAQRALRGTTDSLSTRSLSDQLTILGVALGLNDALKPSEVLLRTKEAGA